MLKAMGHTDDSRAVITSGEIVTAAVVAAIVDAPMGPVSLCIGCLPSPFTVRSHWPRHAKPGALAGAPGLPLGNGGPDEGEAGMMVFTGMGLKRVSRCRHPHPDRG